jgi:hypothetical protein
MTTLISWLGSDSRGPASIYIAADSRITFGPKTTWDKARKTFASHKHPEIFGYCGDAFLPSQILSQAVELLDRGLLFDVCETSGNKVSVLVDFINNALESYTERASLRFDLVYASREGEGTKCGFALHKLSYCTGKWTPMPCIVLPEKSELLLNLGSGCSSIKNHISRWSKSSVG